MYHLRFKDSHYNIGVKRGQIFNKLNIKFPLNMDHFQLTHGIESEKILNKYILKYVKRLKELWIQ